MTSRPSTFFTRSVSLPWPCRVATQRPTGPVRADSAPTAIRRTAFMCGTKYGSARPIVSPDRAPLAQPPAQRAPPMPMREELLLALMRTLAEQGASFGRLEATGVTLSCILDVPVTLVRRPGTLTCFAGDRTGRRKFVRVRRTRRARAVSALGSVHFGAIAPLALVVGASVFASTVASVVLNGTALEVLLAFAAMMIFGTTHALVRQIGGRILPDRVFAAFMMIILSWSAHTPLTSTTLTSTIAGYLFLCSTFAQAHVRRSAPTAGASQVGAVAVFSATYALTLSRGLPAHLDLFLFASVWRLAVMVVRAKDLRV